MNLKQIVENVLSTSQMDALPEELQPATFFPWTHDLNTTKDWDDFLNGFLTCHTEWDGVTSFKGMVDMTNLQYGTNTNNIYSALNNNPTINIYTSQYLNFNEKFISIGDDYTNQYLAISHELQDFKWKSGPLSAKKVFLGKITLVNIRKFLDFQMNDSAEGPIINIFPGKLNSTIKVPKISARPAGQTSDPNIDKWEAATLTIPAAVNVEVMYPGPAVHVGGLDFVTNAKRKTDKIANLDRLAKVVDVSSSPGTFPKQPYYSILPTQFAVPAIDNYGFTHPADRSNEIQVLLATQQVGSIASTGTDLATTGGLVGKLGSGLLNAGIGISQKFLGDRGTLANSTAITASVISGDNDTLKFFIQGDGIKNGTLDLSALSAQNDYLEINCLNGSFGKYGKSMSPSNNGNFQTKNTYRALGLDSIKTSGVIPALATPFAGNDYPNTKMTPQLFKDYMMKGAPRFNVFSGDEVAPMITPEQWPVYIRNMFFRPDPYSFWNWPCLMPSELGVYDVENTTSIAYDNNPTDADGAFSAIAKFFGTENSVANSQSRTNSMWSRTLMLSHITNNDYGDPNKTYSSFLYKLDARTAQDLYKIEGAVITSSTVAINILDVNNQLVRSYRFNSAGKVFGTSANWNNFWQL